ncbi:MAG: CHAT domain-containing protein, partial [Acidobacteriota bacterium]
IEALAESVHRRIGTLRRNDGQLRPTLDALGRALLAPVADRLRNQRLIVVVDGALHLVPLGALTSPRTRQPLLVDHEIVITPSATVLAARRRTVTTSVEGPMIAIVADPIMSPDDARMMESVAAEAEAPARAVPTTGLDALDRLPHTRLEAESIAALAADDQRRLLIGDAARRDHVMAGDLRGHTVLHFATHGFVHPRTPELSGLVLSRFATDGTVLDAFLDAHDVASLQLDAELVVLSGCRTAHGKAIDGEGLVGLSHAFMVAGARQVIASLWQVRDRATADLMTRFYRALWVDGRSPAAALRAAKLGVRSERRFRDPYFWAAFELYGDDHPNASLTPRPAN